MKALQFKQGLNYSPTLITHEDIDIENATEDYIQELLEEELPKNSRLAQNNPGTTMVDFIMWLTGETDENNENDLELTQQEIKYTLIYDLNKKTWNPPQR